MKVFKIITVILFGLAPCIPKAQDIYKRLDSLSAAVILNIRAHEKEQATIITDKNIYAVGDKVWFRVLLLKSVSEKISTKSKNVFVQLVDHKDSVVAKIILNARAQHLSGELSINKKLSTGYYWIKAFTGKMADSDPSGAAVSDIYVINPDEDYMAAHQSISNTSSSPVIDFFPEGGSIITGSESLVAFRIHNANGQPVQTSGLLKNNKDTTSVPFFSDQYGLGKVSFFPSRYRKYSAYIKVNNKDVEFPLPSFNFYAGQISYTSSAGNKKLNILLEDSVFSKNTLTYVIGINKDSITFASTGKGMYEIPLSSTQFPPGITTFYLFDNAMHLMSERSVYFSDLPFKVNASVDKMIYNKRSKGELNFSIKDVQQHPVPASLSVSILESSLIQTPDLSKIIKDFFNNRPVSINLIPLDIIPAQDVDVMLLSQQNTYANINRIEPNGTYNYKKDEDILNIHGKLVSKDFKDKLVTLLSTSGFIKLTTDTVHSDGSFIIPAKDYSDSTDFTVVIKSNRGKALDDKVLIAPVQFPQLKRKLDTTLILSEAEKRAAYVFYHSFLIDQQGVKKTNNNSEANKTQGVDDLKRMHPDSKIITGEMMEQQHITSVDNAVRNMPGVQVINGYLTMYGVAGNIPGANTEPLIIFNGNEIQANSQGMDPGLGSPVLSFLKNLNPKDIDFIEILEGPAASTYGLRGGNGVISVHTNNKETTPYNSVPIRSFVAEGYYNTKPFLYPDYDNIKIKNTVVTDLRPTLFFIGNVLTDTDGNLKLPFYTSDISGNYNIVIKGITVHGDRINTALQFSVK